MEKKAFKLLVVLLVFSFVVYAAAVPATRIPMNKKVDGLFLEDQSKEIVDIKNQTKLLDTKEELEEATRMILDVTDYPPTGPNHSHTPISPGKP